VQDGVDEMSSDVQEAARIRVQLRDVDEGIVRNQDVLADLAAEGQAAERAIAEIEQRRATDVDRLKQGKTLLDQGREAYVIAGRKYTRAEVSADAAHRLDQCKENDEAIVAHRKIRDEAAIRVKEGEALILKARAEKQKAEVSLNQLVARINNARMMGRLDELTGKFQAAGASSELGKSLAAFRKRAEKIERRNAYYHGAATSGTIVAWEAAGAADESVRGAIGDYLKGHPEAAPAGRAGERTEVPPARVEEPATPATR
jgi:hypothetical protein